MAWPAPKPADIVWCYVPYEHPDGSTSLVRHPALVVAVDSAKAIISGGNPKLGVLDGSHPALLEKYRWASVAVQGEQLKGGH